MTTVDDLDRLLDVLIKEVSELEQLFDLKEWTSDRCLEWQSDVVDNARAILQDVVTNMFIKFDDYRVAKKELEDTELYSEHVIVPTHVGIRRDRLNPPAPSEALSATTLSPPESPAAQR